ncbi:hypothetical protein DFH09DRAFT_1282717 [Mycena vulgaris]|nr:hypothetical protein DFH09DRAFT_1282717 [Mycena vulgaris]
MDLGQRSPSRRPDPPTLSWMPAIDAPDSTMPPFHTLFTTPPTRRTLLSQVVSVPRGIRTRELIPRPCAAGCSCATTGGLWEILTGMRGAIEATRVAGREGYMAHETAIPVYDNTDPSRLHSQKLSKNSSTAGNETGRGRREETCNQVVGRGGRKLTVRFASERVFLRGDVRSPTLQRFLDPSLDDCASSPSTAESSSTSEARRFFGLGVARVDGGGIDGLTLGSDAEPVARGVLRARGGRREADASGCAGAGEGKRWREFLTSLARFVVEGAIEEVLVRRRGREWGAASAAP